MSAGVLLAPGLDKHCDCHRDRVARFLEDPATRECIAAVLLAVISSTRTAPAIVSYQQMAKHYADVLLDAMRERAT